MLHGDSCLRELAGHWFVWVDGRLMPSSFVSMTFSGLAACNLVTLAKILLRILPLRDLRGLVFLCVFRDYVRIHRNWKLDLFDVFVHVVMSRTRRTARQGSGGLVRYE